jgi:hypothetical protein
MRQLQCYSHSNGTNTCVTVANYILEVCDTLVQIYNGVGEEQTTSLSDFIIYPNPASGENLTLSFEIEKEETISCFVADISGRLVATPFSETKKQKGKHSIDIKQNLSAGIYFCDVECFGQNVFKEVRCDRMKNSFLDKVSQHIVDHYADETEHLCIVLPNRRAGLFLRSMIGKKLNKPVWSPTIFSIEDFIIKLSGHQLADSVSLMFRLYKAYKECEGAEAQTLDEFCNWGQSILGDFNEVDMHLADADKLFSHLKGLKEMEAWNPETGHVKQKYLEFYFSLGKLYKIFTAQLLAENAVYYGLACRIVNENAAERCTQANNLRK